MSETRGKEMCVCVCVCVCVSEWRTKSYRWASMPDATRRSSPSSEYAQHVVGSSIMRERRARVLKNAVRSTPASSVSRSSLASISAFSASLIIASGTVGGASGKGRGPNTGK